MSNAANDPLREVRLGKLMTAEEVATELEVNEATIYRWSKTRNGPKPAINKGKRIRLFYLPDVLNWCKFHGKGPYRKSKVAGEVRVGEKGQP